MPRQLKTFNELECRGKLSASNSKLVAFFGQKIVPLGKIALTSIQRSKESLKSYKKMFWLYWEEHMCETRLTEKDAWGWKGKWHP